MENTNSWCHHNWSPWKVSNGTRQRTSDAYWKKPLKWNREAFYDFDNETRVWAVANGVRRESLLQFGSNKSLDSLIRQGWIEVVDGLYKRKGRRPGDPERPRIFPSLCDIWEDWDGPMVNANGTHLVHGLHGPIPEDNEQAESCSRYTMSDCRRDFFQLIDKTPNLDYLLLTKRPENIPSMTHPRKCREDCDGCDAQEWCSGFYMAPCPCRKCLRRENVWLGMSASDQPTLESGIDHLLACRDLTPCLFLSAEPLLGPLDLSKWIENLDFIIIGGESGPNARPCQIEWIRDIVKQCKAADVPCWVKQVGANPVGYAQWLHEDNEGHGIDIAGRKLSDPKGADPEEWPEDIRVQELPNVTRT